MTQALRSVACHHDCGVMTPAHVTKIESVLPSRIRQGLHEEVAFKPGTKYAGWSSREKDLWDKSRHWIITTKAGMSEPKFHKIQLGDSWPLPPGPTLAVLKLFAYGCTCGCLS